MSLVFPTPAQAAVQTPVNTFSPSSTPLANSSNSNTYTYIPAKGVWVLGTSSSGVASIAVVSPLSSTGGSSPTLSIGTASTATSGAVQLNDTITSPSTTQAATPNAVRQVADLAGAAIPCACLLSKGDILGASAASTPTALPVGTDGQVLVACSTSATGLCWTAGTSITVTSPITNTGTAIAPIIGIQDATVGQKGAVQIGTNISVTSGTISVADAIYALPGDATSSKGVSILNATTTQTVKGQSLDATVGKTLQDQINSLLTTSNLTLAGTFNASTPAMADVTAAGTAAGFTSGSDLPAPAPALTDYYVIVTVGGTYDPPGAGGPYTAVQGDWFLCDGTEWVFLNVGYDPPAASDTTPGLVELATSVETQTGTDATRAVTPAGAAATYISCSVFAAKGDIISASANDTPLILPVGTDSQILAADSTTATGLKWVPGVGDATPILSGKILGYTSSAGTNTSIGSCALGAAGTLGSCNTAVGVDALKNTSVGSATAIGYGALEANTTGSQVTAVGARALCSNTTGGFNTAVGRAALISNTTGFYNIAVGGDALVSNVSGNLNTGVGYNSLGFTTASNNTGLGSCAVFRNTTGTDNTGIGHCALQAKQTGCFNTAVGSRALAASTILNPGFSHNTAIGYASLGQNNIGEFNTTLGSGTLKDLTDGSCNIAIGYCAGCVYTTESGNAIFGASFGVVGESNTVTLADGAGNLKAKFDSAGALSFDGTTFGTAGQVLQSNGPGAKPTWVAGGGGGGGTVTSITAGTGLTGGTITTTGTIALDNTAVTAGSYTYASFTVDAQGRLTAASDGTAPVTAVTGTAPISVTAGTTPDVSITAASTTACGAVELATDAETATGISQTLAVTPFGARCTYVPKVILFKGALITACTSGTPVGLAPGSDGQVLTANSFVNAGLEWQTPVVAISATPSAEGLVVGCTTLTNTALGCNTLFAVTTGGCNTALGVASGCTITTGSMNVAIGYGAQVPSAGGNCQLVVGWCGGVGVTCCWLSGDSTRAIRPGAGIIDCGGSCGTNGQVLMSNGANAVCWGAGGGASAATPSVLGTVFGCTVAASSTTALGSNAFAGGSGNNNTAIGSGSQQVTTGGSNSSLGRASLQGNGSGACNVAVGMNSMISNTSGSNNTALGYDALRRNSDATGNTAIGWSAMQCNTTGQLNTSLGAFSLAALTTGCGNLGVGLYAGCSITTGGGNVVVGGSNSGGAYVPVFTFTGAESNIISVGSTAVTSANVQVAWTVVSDARDKIVNGDVVHGLDFVTKLEPKSYYFKETRDSEDPHGPERYGFLAQDVLEIEGENPVIVNADNPEKLRMNESHLVPILVNAIKELSSELNAVKEELAILRSNG